MYERPTTPYNSHNTCSNSNEVHCTTRSAHQCHPSTSVPTPPTPSTFVSPHFSSRSPMLFVPFFQTCACFSFENHESLAFSRRRTFPESIPSWPKHWLPLPATVLVLVHPWTRHVLSVGFESPSLFFCILFSPRSNLKNLSRPKFLCPPNFARACLRPIDARLSHCHVGATIPLRRPSRLISPFQRFDPVRLAIFATVYVCPFLFVHGFVEFSIGHWTPAPTATIARRRRLWRILCVSPTTFSGGLNARARETNRPIERQWGVRKKTRFPIVPRLCNERQTKEEDYE
jgi:hypothetical protein